MQTPAYLFLDRSFIAYAGVCFVDGACFRDGMQFQTCVSLSSPHKSGGNDFSELVLHAQGRAQERFQGCGNDFNT